MAKAVGAAQCARPGLPCWADASFEAGPHR